MNLILNHFNQFLWLIVWSATILNALILADWIQLRFDAHIEQKTLKQAHIKPQHTLDSFKLTYERQ